MGVSLGWVALAWAGVASAPSAEHGNEQITYHVRMVETQGVSWREGVFTRLKPVTRQGAATVWTVPRDATKQLLDEFSGCLDAKVVESPKVTALSGAPATIQSRRNRTLVTQAAWNGQDPATAAAPEHVRAGWHTTMVGRKLDQGILVQVVFEDTVIRAVHHVSAGKGTDVQKVVFDVPEIETQEVLGEWLVPRGEALLVSFGAHTVADKDGKAVVKERLAMIETDLAAGGTSVIGTNEFHPTPVWVIRSQPSASPAPPPVAVSPDRATAPIGPNVPPPPIGTPSPLPRIAMPAPIMPSRSIPRGVHADGTPADLPPLPDDETESDTSSSESSEPMASPQTKKIPQSKPKPATDSGTNKAEFTLPKAATMFLPSFLMPSPSLGFQFMLPVKPLSLKLPFGQKLEVDLIGRIVPEPEGR